MCCVTLKVYGRVQGVFFRSSVKDKARALKVEGYASNLRDGSVEAVFYGEDTAVQQLIEFCRNSPGYSHVEEVIVNESKEVVEKVKGKGFVIR